MLTADEDHDDEDRTSEGFRNSVAAGVGFRRCHPASAAHRAREPGRRDGTDRRLTVDHGKILRRIQKCLTLTDLQMTTLTQSDFEARVAACERCAVQLEASASDDPHQALADAWLARKLRSEVQTWALLAAKPIKKSQNLEPIVGKKPVTKPITERMAETLAQMDRGALVETEKFFSWPRWKFDSTARNYSSLLHPSRAMLEGLSERGLLGVQEGKTWVGWCMGASLEFATDWEGRNE